MNAIRKLKRNVAKNRMKKKGLHNICRKEGNKHSSMFSSYWRDYVKGSVSNG